MKSTKVALVCDWLTNVGGAEKVLLELHKMYPKAPIYTSQYNPKKIDWFRDADVRTGWFLQKMPSMLRRILGPFRQWYFSHLDLSEYDLIISVTGAEAKAVKSGKWLHAHGKRAKNPNGVHVCYCHVPTQYYWQMYETYLKNPGFGALNFVVRFFFKLMVKPLRRADYKAAQGPDFYVTISEYSQKMIRRYYDRKATVIHPPVEIDGFQCEKNSKTKPFVASSRRPVVKGGALSSGPVASSDSQDFVFELLPYEYYITTSRQVNWKRIDIAVEACMMRKRKLLVIGEGPEHARLIKMAKGSELVEFLPVMGKNELARYLAGAKGYLFPSLEPFGIAPVEALAAGCPVIAYGEGGALDYLKDGVNGVLFKKQSAKSMAEAMTRFEKIKFDRAEVAKSAEKYDSKRFDQEIREYIDEKIR